MRRGEKGNGLASRAALPPRAGEGRPWGAGGTEEGRAGPCTPQVEGEMQKRSGRGRASLGLLAGFVGPFVISLAETSDRKSLVCAGIHPFNILNYGRPPVDHLLCFLR